jgi:aryl-alcohol dehydrogenase-like predicted oxidoreductase
MITRRNLLSTAATGAAAGALAPAQSPAPEWRNRQPGMAYRQLGRTGLMVSEIVCGGDPIRLNNLDHLNVAMELGLNYLDMAPAYGRGEAEQAYGKFLGGSARREKFFLATKVSGLTGLRNRLYLEIFKQLPEARQKAIQQRANELLEASGGMKPGYFMEYWPGITRELPAAYLSNAMMPDFAHRVEASKDFRKFILDSLDGSLKRVGADYFDIFHIPHGAAAPEELDIPEILATFQDLKKQGKVRFLGLSTHSDPAAMVRKAAALGHYDMVMCAYNFVNGAALDSAIREAAARGVGIIAMKAAMAAATQHKQLQPVPEWRIAMINRMIPGAMKPAMKAYLWVLQNPHVAAAVSNLWDETHVRENLSLAGKKVKLELV